MLLLAPGGIRKGGGGLKEKLLRLKAYIWTRGWLLDLLCSLCFFCTLVGLDGTLRFVYRGTSLTGFFSITPWGFTLAWAVMLTALTHLLPRKGRRIAMGVIGGFSCLLYLTHALLIRAKDTFFSFSILIFAGDGFKFLDASYLQVRKLVWIGFFCGVTATALSIFLVPHGKRGRASQIVSLVLVPLCILAIRLDKQQTLTDRLQIHFNIHQASILYEDFSIPNECLPLAGLYQYTFRDFCVTYGVYDKLNRVSNGDTVKALDEWYAAKVPDPDNQWTGRYKGKNLLLIQLEAIDTWMIEEEFMPNLSRLQREGLDFTQHFTPLYLDAGTFNTEMIVNTGLVSPFTGSTSSMYNRNAYPDSLAHLMTAAGYTANSFHRSGGDIYNRAEIHMNWGYAQYHSGEDMGIPGDRLDYDTELMRAYDTITAGQPFLSFIITYSAHGPYLNSIISQESFDWAAQRLPAGTSEMLIHAHAHAYETDQFIGQLYDRLEADGLLEDTVLVLYADHYDYYTLDNNLIMQQKGVQDLNFITRTPFIIYEKNSPAMKIDKVTSSYDVLPTLVNLFGLDNDGVHYVGNDIFSDNGGVAIFADYSWYDGEIYWNTLGTETPTEAILQRSAEIRQRLQMSWDTMKLNYFATTS